MDKENIIIEPYPGLLKKSAAENTLWLALSYSEAMVFLCNGIVEDEFDRDFYNTRVILQLAHHATELFLKGTILQKGVKVSRTHSLEQLYKTYRNIYPSKNYEFEIPFEILKTRSGELFPELVIPETPLSEKFRYATHQDGTIIYEDETFDAKEWLDKLQELKNRFVIIYFRLKKLSRKKVTKKK